MDGQAKRKVSVRVTYNAPSTSSRPPSRTSSPRPPSPMKYTSSMDSSAGTGSTFRPKAKVNSSATIRKSPSVVSVTPRAGSPTKLTRAQAPKGTLTPSFQPRATVTAPTAKVTIRPQTPVSAPNTPVLQHKPSLHSEVGRGSARIRDGSTLHHAMSFSSLQTTTAAQDSNASPPVRIRSKVSKLSKPATNENTVPSLQPAATPPIRARSPSTSSSISAMRTMNTQTPPPPPIPAPHFYPITSGSPAANPHRYGQRSPPTGQHAFQGIGRISQDPVSQPVYTGARVASIAKVKLPPSSPPQSPPGSAVSFSSRSSVSQSSRGESSIINGAFTEAKRQGNGAADVAPVQPTAAKRLSSSLGNRTGEDDSDQSSGPSNKNEHKVKAAAKSNRKMADLEITNRSLLTINSSLEATKNKQAKEIRDLRRKLRESRLILPPRDYRAVKSSLGPDDDDGDGEDEEDSEVEDAAEGNGDEIYKRVKLMLEGLISSGKKALETKVEDFAEGGKGGAKVLTAEEVKSWHRGNAEDTEAYSDADSMSISQADISIASSIDGDQTEDDDNHLQTPFYGSELRFRKPTGPPIHVSEVD